MAIKALADIRNLVEGDLTDAGNATWSTAEIDRALRRALYAYSEARPQQVIGPITSATSREYSTASLTGMMDIQRIWFPYDVTAPDYPPKWVDFELWDDKAIIHLLVVEDPLITDKPLRVFYTIPHTIKDLDSAGAGTYFEEDEETIVLGATAYAAIQRTRYVVDTVNPSVATPENWREWGEERLKEFNRGLEELRKSFEQQRLASFLARDVTPGTTRTLAGMRDLVEADLTDSGNVGWKSSELDRAIRQALHRYSEVRPQEAIGSIAAEADREYSLATLTGLLDVQHVWFPYLSTAPAYPPNWVAYELWDDKTVLFLKVDDTPAATDDPLRVFYTKLHTINGLDGAAASTYFVEDEEVLVLGAVAFAAVQRARMAAESGMDSALVGRVAAWAQARLRDFEAGLDLVARRVVRHLDSRVGIDLDI